MSAGYSIFGIARRPLVRDYITCIFILKKDMEIKHKKPSYSAKILLHILANQNSK